MIVREAYLERNARITDPRRDHVPRAAWAVDATIHGRAQWPHALLTDQHHVQLYFGRDPKL
ncbi:hypothetical protein EBR44_13925 [bacterium]|nr:hypothetical protein [bacterium]